MFPCNLIKNVFNPPDNCFNGATYNNGNHPGGFLDCLGNHINSDWGPFSEGVTRWANRFNAGFYNRYAGVPGPEAYRNTGAYAFGGLAAETTYQMPSLINPGEGLIPRGPRPAPVSVGGDISLPALGETIRIPWLGAGGTPPNMVQSADNTSDGGVCKVYENTLAGDWEDERTGNPGVEPLTLNPGWDEYIADDLKDLLTTSRPGTNVKIKWGITPNGKLRVVPSNVPHSFLNDGGPLQAAGEAILRYGGHDVLTQDEIALYSGNGYSLAEIEDFTGKFANPFRGLRIDNWSGHYQPNPDAAQLGAGAFGNIGITFEVVDPMPLNNNPIIRNYYPNR